jgi:translation initiation factor 2B subunit (eIF-2B alpha/beta/delta family)
MGVGVKRFEKILQDIKSLKIQGATNVALAGINAFLSIKPEEKSLPEREHSALQIVKSRPTEPLLRNAIHALVYSKKSKKTAEQIRSYIKDSKKKIAQQGLKLIKNNMNIFTHCHSSSVVELLKLAKKRKKHFVVYNTETFPIFQGRQTAQELAKAGIKVIHLPDTAAEQALKNCDLFLFGADAYMEEGIVNKIGTRMLCEIAKIHNIPSYSVGISLKFSKKIKLEMRSGKEVWDERETNIEVLNPAFDFTPYTLTSGVICEKGIFSHESSFVKFAENNLLKFGMH